MLSLAAHSSLTVSSMTAINLSFMIYEPLWPHKVIRQAWEGASRIETGFVGSLTCYNHRMVCHGACRGYICSEEVIYVEEDAGNA